MLLSVYQSVFPQHVHGGNKKAEPVQVATLLAVTGEDASSTRRLLDFQRLGPGRRSSANQNCATKVC